MLHILRNAKQLFSFQADFFIILQFENRFGIILKFSCQAHSPL